MNKFRSTFVIYYLLLVACHLNAQVTFQKTYNNSSWDIGSSVQLTADGEYVIAGSTFAMANNDFCLIKINTNGDTLWTKTFGGAGSDVCNSMQQTFDEGYVLVGKTTSFGTGGDIYVIRVDFYGDTLWTKTFGGNGDDIGISIQQTQSENYIITGASASFGSGSYDMCLILIDTNVSIVWTKVLGGVDGDWGNCVQQTFDKNYIIAGLTNSFGEGMDEVYLVLADSSGDTVWTRAYGGGGNDEVRFIQQMPDSGFAIAGGSGSFAVSGVYLIRTDINGDILWTRTYGDSCGEVAWGFDQTSDGGYILAGETCGYGADWWDAYMLKVDSMGNVMWSKTYKFDNNMKNTFYDVKQTADGGFIAVGETGSLTTRDVYVVKTDANGNSGCGEKDVNTIVGSTNTIVSSTNTIVGSGGIVGGTNTIVGSTNTVEGVLCFDTITGIDQKSEMLKENCSLEIFPNPVQEIVYFKNIPASKKMTLFISNILGQVIYQAELTERSINTAFMRSGIYFLNLQTDDTSFKAKLVKK